MPASTMPAPSRRKPSGRRPRASQPIAMESGIENRVQNSFWNWLSMALVVTTRIRSPRPRRASSAVIRPASKVFPRPTSSAIRSRTRSCASARSTGRC